MIGISDLQLKLVLDSNHFAFQNLLEDQINIRTGIVTKFC
jgi:hypothetical protein